MRLGAIVRYIQHHLYFIAPFVPYHPIYINISLNAFQSLNDNDKNNFPMAILLNGHNVFGGKIIRAPPEIKWK